MQDKKYIINGSKQFYIDFKIYDGDKLVIVADDDKEILDFSTEQYKNSEGAIVTINEDLTNYNYLSIDIDRSLLQPIDFKSFTEYKTDIHQNASDRLIDSLLFLKNKIDLLNGIKEALGRKITINSVCENGKGLIVKSISDDEVELVNSDIDIDDYDTAIQNIENIYNDIIVLFDDINSIVANIFTTITNINNELTTVIDLKDKTQDHANKAAEQSSLALSYINYYQSKKAFIFYYNLYDFVFTQSQSSSANSLELILDNGDTFTGFVQVSFGIHDNDVPLVDFFGTKNLQLVLRFNYGGEIAQPITYYPYVTNNVPNAFNFNLLYNFKNDTGTNIAIKVIDCYFKNIDSGEIFDIMKSPVFENNREYYIRQSPFTAIGLVYAQ